MSSASSVAPTPPPIPAPVEMIETTVTLKPRSEWRAGMTKDKLVAEMNQAMQIVGYVNSWTQPINTRVMMQDTGIQTPVGHQGEGEGAGGRRGDRAEHRGAAQGIPGTQAVIAERISRGYFVDAQLDLEQMAAARRDGRRGDAHRAVRDRRRQRRRHQAARQDHRAAGHPVFPRVHRYAGQGAEHAGRDRGRAVRAAGRHRRRRGA